MWRVGAFFLMFTAVEGSSVRAAQRACPTCEAKLSMTRPEWQCLASRLERYSRTNADPVLIPRLASCGEPQVRPRDRDPNIDIEARDNGAPPLPRALRLTQGQLSCLRRHIDEILARPQPTSTFDFALCPIGERG
jgi:hypothetical protein